MKAIERWGSMHRRSRLRRAATLIAALTALALLAIPALANAKPELQNANGEIVPPGTEIRGKSTNLRFQTMFGTGECADVAFSGEITRSEETAVEAVGVGEGSTTNCAVGGLSLNTNWAVENITFTPDGQGYAEMAFTQEWPILGTCHFETPAGGGVFTYASGWNQIQFRDLSLIGSASICDPMIVDATFTLEEEGGGLLKLL